MLTPPDALVAAGDPALPGLAHLLDPERLAAAITDRLPGVAPLTLEPSYLRYKPGTSCLGGFVARSAAGEVTLAAKAMPPNRYAVERVRPVKLDLRSPWGPVVVRLDAAAVLLRLAPYDRRLNSLRLLTDPGERRSLLARLAPELADGDWQVLRHKPERRHIIRLVRHGEPQAVLKHYATADFRQAESGARFAAAVGGPALLAGHRRRHLLISAWQPGRPLAELADAPGQLSHLAAAGAALATIHAQPPQGLPARTTADEGLALVEVARGLDRLTAPLGRRALGERARRLAGCTAERLLVVPEAVRPLHGDFSADQVIVGAGGVRIIDWDAAAVGPPALDLGTFVARLEADALAAGKLPPEASIGAFRHGYTAQADGGVAALGPWVAAALLRLVEEPFRQRHPAWPEAATALLDRAEAYLETHCGTRRAGLGRTA